MQEQNEGSTFLLEKLEKGESVSFSAPQTFKTIEVIPILVAVGALSLVLSMMTIYAVTELFEFDLNSFHLVIGFIMSLVVVFISFRIHRDDHKRSLLVLSKNGCSFNNKLYMWSSVQQASSNDVDPDFNFYEFIIVLEDSYIRFITSAENRDRLGLVLKKYAQLEQNVVTDHRFPYYQWVKKGHIFQPITWRDKLSIFLQNLVRWKL